MDRHITSWTEFDVNRTTRELVCLDIVFCKQFRRVNFLITRNPVLVMELN